MIKYRFILFPFLTLILLFFNGLFLPTTLLSQEIQINIPQQIDENSNQKDVLVKETFYSYPFTGEIIDLRAFKRINPSLDLPDSYTVQLPNFADIEDKTLLIGYLKNAADGKNYLVTIIVGNYNTNEATFFLDTNFDNDYRNEGAPLVLFGGATPTTVFLEPPKARKFSLALALPKKLDQIEEKLRELDAINKKFKTKISNKITVGFAIGVGAGKLDYQYDNIELGYPTWYNVRFVEKAFRTSLGYDFSRFRFGIDATFINHFYYTSYLNVQFAEPRGIKSGILTERNIDQHALNKLQIGLNAAYRIRLSRYSEIQPMFSYGKNIYLSDVYFSDNRPRKEKFYQLSPNNYFEYGAQMEFTVGNQKVFLFNVLFNQVLWKPDDFVAELETNNLTTNHSSWKIMLGYRFSIF